MSLVVEVLKGLKYYGLVPHTQVQLSTGIRRMFNGDNNCSALYSKTRLRLGLGNQPHIKQYLFSCSGIDCCLSISHSGIISRDRNLLFLRCCHTLGNSPPRDGFHITQTYKTDNQFFFCLLLSTVKLFRP